MISEVWAEPSLTFTSMCLSQRGRSDGAYPAHLVRMGWEGSRQLACRVTQKNEKSPSARSMQVVAAKQQRAQLL